MSARKPTRAEQLARHRRVFLLARAHGVTLAEAEKLLAREEWETAQRRLEATRRCGRAVASRDTGACAANRYRFKIKGDEPWMMRD